MKSQLVILDVTRNLKNRFIKDADIIQLSPGECKLQNCRVISNNYFSEKKFLIFKRKLKKILDQYFQIIKQKSSDIDPYLLEFFNLRNDKNKFYDKIFYILMIKEKIKDYKKINIITDDKNFVKTYESLKSKKIKIDLVNKNNNKFNQFYYIKKVINFFLKRLIFQFYIKFFLKKENISNINSNACLSIFPIFFKKNKNFFYNEKLLNINFQVTDETHLGKNLIENINLSKKIDLLQNTISIEKFVNFSCIFLGFFKSLFHINIIKSTLKKKFSINDLDISDQLNNLLIQSIINYNKLFIYKKAFKKVIDKFEIKKFHYFLFEYNFGYFLSKTLGFSSPSVKKIGYQHGIYSERLLWQDFLKNKRGKNKYFPHKIFIKFKECENVYKNNFQNIMIDKTKSIKFSKKIVVKSKRHNSYLVYLGLHDAIQMLSCLKNLSLNKYILIKTHPKFKLKIRNLLKKNMKLVKNIRGKFKKVYLSPSSTMVFEFLNKKENFSILNASYSIPLNLRIFDKKINKY